jgi:hypothetical protein
MESVLPSVPIKFPFVGVFSGRKIPLSNPYTAIGKLGWLLETQTTMRISAKAAKVRIANNIVTIIIHS